MVSGHQACTFGICPDIFQQNTKVQSARRSVQLLVSFPNCHFRNLSGYFSTDLESVMVLSQSTDFKSVLWPFWTDLKSVTFGATHPYRLQICHPQIVSYFFNRFQICRGFWGGQISKLHGKTDFKSVRSAKVQISNLSTPEPPYRFQICHLRSFESCRYKIGK